MTHNLILQGPVKLGKSPWLAEMTSCWVAEIMGADPRYNGLRRDYLPAHSAEREHPESMIVALTWQLSPGMYEVYERGTQRFVRVTESGCYGILYRDVLAYCGMFYPPRPEPGQQPGQSGPVREDALTHGLTLRHQGKLGGACWLFAITWGQIEGSCWVAEIMGADPRYGLLRDFLSADSVERKDSEYFLTWWLTWRLSPGVYEVSEDGTRQFIRVTEDDRCYGISYRDVLAELERRDRTRQDPRTLLKEGKP